MAMSAEHMPKFAALHRCLHMSENSQVGQKISIKQTNKQTNVGTEVVPERSLAQRSFWS